MRCPYCGRLDSKVIDSRPSEENNTIRRRRQCEHCEKRFTTYETVENTPLMVVKKDGNREPYTRDKIVAGLISSCHKRPISREVIDRLVDEVETELYQTMKKEVASSLIGGMVMGRLKTLDQVAYVRFASIYREFQDIKSFRKELDKIEPES